LVAGAGNPDAALMGHGNAFSERCAAEPITLLGRCGRKNVLVSQLAVDSQDADP
jgi:hypothetical protein